MRPTRWKPENSQTPGNWRLHFSMCCSMQTRGVDVCQFSCLEMYNLYLPDHQAPRLITTRTELLETRNDAVWWPCHRAPAPLPFKSTLMEVHFCKMTWFQTAVYWILCILATSKWCFPSLYQWSDFRGYKLNFLTFTREFERDDELGGLLVVDVFVDWSA